MLFNLVCLNCPFPGRNSHEGATSWQTPEYNYTGQGFFPSWSTHSKNKFKTKHDEYNFNTSSMLNAFLVYHQTQWSNIEILVLLIVDIFFHSWNGGAIYNFFKLGRASSIEHALWALRRIFIGKVWPGRPANEKLS